MKKINCANLIINDSLFLLQGGNIISLEIINCDNNSNRKNTVKLLVGISKPGYLRLNKVMLDTYKKNLHFLFTPLAFNVNSASLKIRFFYIFLSIISGQIEITCFGNIVTTNITMFIFSSHRKTSFPLDNSKVSASAIG